MSGFLRKYYDKLNINGIAFKGFHKRTLDKGERGICGTLQSYDDDTCIHDHHDHADHVFFPFTDGFRILACYADLCSEHSD